MILNFILYKFYLSKRGQTMKYKMTLFILLLSLSGCATIPKVVYVPTPVSVPKPKLSPLPSFPVLSPTATPAEYVKWCTVNQ